MNCSERKVLSTADGLVRTNAHETVSTSSSARKKPSKGEKTMAAAVMPRPLHTIEPSPALVTAAPASPPIKACELLEGIPHHQVNRFQQLAPINAPKITAASTTSAATIPVPTVWATWSPKNKKAMKLKNAAHMTAYCGRSTRVDTTVAIELAASCRPFKKSKINATEISATRTKKPSWASIGGRNWSSKRSR